MKKISSKADVLSASDFIAIYPSNCILLNRESFCIRINSRAASHGQNKEPR